MHHGRADELAVVGGQPDLARLLQDGARHAHLAVVEVAQRAVGLDARDADQRDVHLELAHERHRGLADDGAVARPHRAAGDEQLAVRMIAEDRRHVEVVGDDAQPAVPHQRVRDGLGGGADVDDQRAAVRHRLGHRLGDAPLGGVVEALAPAVGDVLGGRARRAHAAVEAPQQAGLGQQAHVAAHRLQRHAEAFGQRLHAQAAGLAHLLDQLDLARMNLLHGGGNLVEPGRTHIRVIKEPMRKQNEHNR